MSPLASHATSFSQDATTSMPTTPGPTPLMRQATSRLSMSQTWTTPRFSDDAISDRRMPAVVPAQHRLWMPFCRDCGVSPSLTTTGAAPSPPPRSTRLIIPVSSPTTRRSVGGGGAEDAPECFATKAARDMMGWAPPYTE